MFMMTRLMMVFLLCCAGIASAEEPNDERIKYLGEQIVSAEDFARRGHLRPDGLTAVTNENLAEASKLVGRTLTLTDLKNWSRRSGAVDTLDYVSVVAMVMLTAAFAGLMAVYRKRLAAAVPKAIWDFVFCGISLWLLFGATDFALTFLGAILLPAAISFTLVGREIRRDLTTPIAIICMLVWGFMAHKHSSPALGFLAVLALETLIGLSPVITPLCYLTGFRDRNLVSSGTLAAFILLAVGVGLSLSGDPSLVILGPFRLGLLSIGTFVYFTGLLIVSNRYFASKENYGLIQFLAVASCLAAIYLGNVVGVQHLSGIGGAFFVLYVLSKVFVDIPWKNTNWLWPLLAISLAAFLALNYLKAHAEYFIPNLSAM